MADAAVTAHHEKPAGEPPGAGASARPSVDVAKTKRLGVLGYVAVGWLVLIVLAAVLAPWLPIKDPNELYDLKRGSKVLGPGTSGHLLGGDSSGRDLFARLIWGARSSLLLAVLSIALGLFVGGLIGLIAGYFRGRLDTIVSGAVDALLAIPQIVLALALVAVFAPTDALNPVSSARRMVVLILGLAIVSVPTLARIARASTLSWSQREFVTAARSIGTKNRRIIFHQILPNVVPAMFSISLLGIAVVIVAEGGLSILGVGVLPPTPSWGNILAENYSNLRNAIWPLLAPSIAIFLTVLSLNYLGDVIRARFDVKESAI